MFPRASWSNLLTTSPIVVVGIQSGSAVNPAQASNFGDGLTGGGLTGVGNYANNGATFDAVRTNAAAILAAATQGRMLGVANPAEWSVQSNPGVNTVATVTRAAGGAGVRHICRSFLATFFNNAAAVGSGTVVVRDGASGAGTILYLAFLAVPAVAQTCFQVGQSSLNLLGSANTAMTVEFLANGGANTFESVSMSGYDTV